MHRLGDALKGDWFGAALGSKAQKRASPPILNVTRASQLGATPAPGQCRGREQPDAATNIAAAVVAGANPDGYTILMGTASLAQAASSTVRCLTPSAILHPLRLCARFHC
jgi:hypothetical protein